MIIKLKKVKAEKNIDLNGHETHRPEWTFVSFAALPHVVNLFNLLFLFTHAILLQYHLRSTVSGISITDLNIVSI